MKPKGPVEVLFSSYHRQILALLLLRDEGFHVREIARLTGIPVGSLHRELRALSESGLLMRQPVGNQVRYQANRGHVIYPELSEMFRKTVGLADVLREALSPLAARIDLAFVFGSMAQGKESAASDIDVMVLGRVTLAAVVGVLSRLRLRLGREINPVVMTKTDFRTKYRDKDRFVTRVAKEPKMFLIGNADDFGKLTQDRAA